VEEEAIASSLPGTDQTRQPLDWSSGAPSLGGTSYSLAEVWIHRHSSVWHCDEHYIATIAYLISSPCQSIYDVVFQLPLPLLHDMPISPPTTSLPPQRDTVRRPPPLHSRPRLFQELRLQMSSSKSRFLRLRSTSSNRLARDKPTSYHRVTVMAAVSRKPVPLRRDSDFVRTPGSP
jgi:hypothetical protein